MILDTKTLQPQSFGSIFQFFHFLSIYNKKLRFSKLTHQLDTQESDMQQLISKFGSLERPSHFFLYCITFMLYATAMAGLGPLIPYLSEKTGYKQTDYSFLIFCKSIGFFTGSILLKKIHDKRVFHNIMMWCLIFLSILMASFSVILDFIPHGIIMIFIATFFSMINILVNVCVVQTQKKGDVHFWMLMLHGTYGIGGLLGPMIIYVFEVDSYLILGILVGLLAPFYFKLQSPEATRKYLKWIANSQFYQFQSYDEASTAKNMKKKYISTKSEYALCFIFWAYIGIELGFGNWISSYVVLQNIDSKEQALKYNSIFWISMTVFRFISLLMPWRTMRKLIANEYILIGFVAYSLLLVFQGQAKDACLFSAVTFGICFSSMYPLLLSSPLDYNLQISATQMTHVALWCAMGELIISPIFGILMEWLSHNMFFYIMFVMGIVLIIATHYLEWLYERDSKIDLKFNSNIQLKQILPTDES